MAKYWLGKKRTQETKDKISVTKQGCIAWNKGRTNLFKHTEEWKKMASERFKGRKPWNYGKKLTAEQKKNLKGRTVWNKGKKMSDEYRIKLSKAHKGLPSPKKGIKGKYKASIETKLKMSIAHRGDKSPLWKGGRMKYRKESISQRRTWEYIFWRKSVYDRDDFTCNRCKQKGGRLVAHHLNNFAEFPELRTVLDNGATLCELCHREFHKKYGNHNNTKGQYIEWINKN